MNTRPKYLNREKIFEMKNSGISVREIANYFEVTIGAIYAHLRRKEKRFCSCGCGEITSNSKCLLGHSGGRVKISRENPLIECACGCGEKFPKYDKYRNPPRKFIHGHNYNLLDFKGNKKEIYVVGEFYSVKNKRNIRYRSSYELGAYLLLENMSKVFSYTNEPFYIKYEFEGKIRKYFPDILIKYTDNTSEIVEVKPNKMVNLPINQAKFSAIRNQFSNFSVWTEDNIGAFLNKSANSENPLLKSEATPNQTQEIGVCVETDVQTPKGMIQSKPE